jgi:hypothetical protein
MLAHALERSPRLAQRRHCMRIDVSAASIAEALQELCRVPYSLPVEGCTLPVATLEDAQVVEGALHYEIGELYAIHIAFLTMGSRTSGRPG